MLAGVYQVGSERERRDELEGGGVLEVEGRLVLAEWRGGGEW